MLKDLQLRYVYDSSEQSIVDELFLPLLYHAKKYQRGVGFFTSGWLQMNLLGILSLIERKGSAEIITSPHLTYHDFEAMQRGEQAREDELLYKKLEEEISVLEQNREVETLSFLAWLIADGLLELKFAIPKNTIGDFHDKFAIFTDETGDKVAIHGSYNDSIHANYNGESFSVYCSWVEGQQPYVEKHEERFKKLYQGENQFFYIYNIPALIKKKLVKITQFTERPYDIRKTNTKQAEEEFMIRIPSGINLHDYQNAAINAWIENDYKGLFTMATGTGKTITSLAASASVYHMYKKICLIISVPFKHLVEQWKSEAQAFGYEPITSTSRNWLWDARSLIDDYNLGFEEHLCLIVTHQSNADKEKFLKLVAKIHDKKNIVFIGDETHYLGAGYLRNSLHTSISKRIGLSATPARWRDQEGTNVVLSYFSKEVINFGLEKAIQEGFLTPYEFHPQYVEMDEQEYAEYKQLTTRIRNLLQAAKTEPSKRESANILAAQRANILNKSENKISAFLRILYQHIQAIGLDEFKHTIVYCPEGKHREVLRHIADLGLHVQEIVAETNNTDRKKILQAFDKGEIQVIVAMKCLDEGVNVPATKRAYFLANTSNPRQFIQRRGRILRKSIGKSKAYLYDFVMYPPISFGEEDRTSEKIVKKEFARFVEFYLCAENHLSIYDDAYRLLDRYGLSYLLHLTPDEIYSSLREELETDESESYPPTNTR